MISLEQLDKMWCSQLAANCDLKTVTAIANRLQKQKAETKDERFGQWSKAVLKSCGDVHGGKLVSAIAVKAWKADGCDGTDGEKEAEK